MIEPLRISIQVACSADHAFSVWTSHASLWWPLAHTMTGEKGLQVVFEPHAGGRIFERTPAGLEVEWGQIIHWEPPQRLGYLWHIATDREHATEVEIHFVPLDTNQTRVDIEHRGWERLGELGPGWRNENRSGWDGVLQDYIAACVRLH
jgi:hypothetical protein